jgi:hypothetical protein
MPPFLVPDDFRAFLRSVVDDLDAPGGGVRVDAEDAFQDACGYGGRAGGAYRFHYLTRDGMHRWTIALAEHEIRAIADGLQIEADGECAEIAHTHRREPAGDPLLIWGGYDDDALSVRSLDDLVTALELLRLAALDEPRVLRAWSPSDDQLVAAIWRDHCAIYVLESADGYATSSGDPRRNDEFEVLDHDGNPLVVRWADCVAWSSACRALSRFAAHGDLGPEIAVERRIPSQLLMHGELDRQAVLAMRAEPARDPRGSSLIWLTATAVPVAVPDSIDATVPVKRSETGGGDPDDPGGTGGEAPRGIEHGETEGEVPRGIERAGTGSEAPRGTDRVPVDAAELAAWARRLIQLLFGRALIELDDGTAIDELCYQLSGLLQAHGDEAEHALDTAEWLANEIGALRGIRRMFATGGDLQVALRRSRVAR